MGKGTIQSGGTDGYYSVEINYNRENIVAEKSALDDKIAAYDVAYAEETDDLKKKMIALKKKSCQKRKDYIDANAPADQNQSIWCADYTEDLSGEVGTIEVPGEIGTILIQPGYNSNAVYSSSRDGQLFYPVAQKFSQLFYNIAMLPGWQKWKPTFRFGTITDIDPGNDTADVTLDSATSSQQSINVNQGSSLTDVSIDYMACNSGAFVVGDEVLVEFTSQDWSNPKIVGFKDNPKACNLVFTLTRGDGTAVDDTQNAYFVVKDSTGNSIIWGGVGEANISYDAVSGAWTITIPEWGKDPDGYYVWYNCTFGINTLYPGVYKTADGVDDNVPPISSLIKPGVYSDTIPYWRIIEKSWVGAIASNIEDDACILEADGDIHTGSIDLNSPYGDSDVLFLVPEVSATRRLTVASSVPFQITRIVNVGAGDYGIIVDSYYYTSDYCNDGPRCWTSVECGNEVDNLSSFQITGGGINEEIIESTDISEYTYENSGASLGGLSFELYVANNTPTDSQSFGCHGDTPGGTYDYKGSFLNIDKCQVDVQADYDY